jgi:hypothetical protein
MSDMHCVAAFLVLGGYFIFPQMAAWRRKHDDTVRPLVNGINAGLRGADLLHKEAAACLDTDDHEYAVSQWCLDIKRGGNLAALIIVGLRHPAFGAALYRLVGELLKVPSESPVERIERLIADLNDRLPQKRETKKCSEVRLRDVSGSSAA